MKRNSNHSSRNNNSSSARNEDGNYDQRKKQFRTKRVKLEQPPADEFPKLDQSDPVHALRIQQRRRMVEFGKNTVGYDEYIKQVPKHKRRRRSMKHPMTPDHTLDIPTKRWQGLVRAWRKALHQYDPDDLMESFAQEASQASDVNTEKDTSTVQGRQIADATTQGLPVDFKTAPPSNPDVGVASPSSVETEASSTHGRDNTTDELDNWDNSRRENDHDFLLEDEDSDDDLL